MRITILLACISLLTTPAAGRDDIDERPMAQRPHREWTPPKKAPKWWADDMIDPYSTVAHRRYIAHCIRVKAKERSFMCTRALEESGLS